MTSEAYAALSAACFAASHVLAKLGFRDTSVTGFLISVGFAWVIVAGAVALDPPQNAPLAGVAMFAASGIFAPAVARAAALMGVHRLGPSVAVPIQQGLRPVLAVAGAAVLLGEATDPVRLLGVIAIVAGGWVLSQQPGASGEGQDTWLHRGFRPGIAFPIVAAMGYAAADLIVKRALDVLPDPAFGALVSTGAGLALWLAALLSKPLRSGLKVGASVGWLLASGAFVGIAMLTLFHALQDGEVSVVAPIVAAQPLIVFALSVLLLGDLERLTRTTVLTGIVIVLGTILVSG